MNTTLNIGYQILEAIEVLHDAGFVHLDIKPDNILISRNNESFENIYLVDFGLTRSYIDENCQVLAPNYKPGWHGSVLYMSLNAHKYGKNGLGN